VTRTSPPEIIEGAPAPPAPDLHPPRTGELTRIRRGVRRRAVRARRKLRYNVQRSLAHALQAWRSSLQVRIGAITMVVAGTVVIIVSLVLFSQIKDQLLSVKEKAAVAQAQAGVSYASTQVAGIAAGDASSVRTTLDRTVKELKRRATGAGDFEVVMVHRTGDRER